jgi:hypothetical protein
MCDVCRFEGMDYKQINYPKTKIIQRSLYTVVKQQIISFKLCYIHDIELFAVGESRFMENHPNLLSAVAKWPEKFAKKDNSEDPEDLL